VILHRITERAAARPVPIREHQKNDLE